MKKIEQVSEFVLAKTMPEENINIFNFRFKLNGKVFYLYKRNSKMVFVLLITCLRASFSLYTAHFLIMLCWLYCLSFKYWGVCRRWNTISQRRKFVSARNQKHNMSHLVELQSKFFSYNLSWTSSIGMWTNCTVLLRFQRVNKTLLKSQLRAPPIHFCK